MAVASLGDQLHPAVIAVTGPGHDLGQHPRQDLAYPHRVGHATSPGAGIGGTARSAGAWAASSSLGSARRPAVAWMMAATWWWSTCGVRGGPAPVEAGLAGQAGPGHAHGGGVVELDR